MLFNAEITWRIATASSEIAADYTEAQVCAEDESAAKKTVEQEFSAKLRWFVVEPVVLFEKIELVPARSCLTLCGGYGA